MYTNRKAQSLQLHRRIVGNMTPHSVWRAVPVRASGIIKNYNKNLEENGKQAYKTKNVRKN